MKKMMVIGALLLCSAVGYAQESRQDISVSGFGLLAPNVQGNGVNPMESTITTGFLGSYRYMVTPRSALEVNYQWTQFYTNYIANVNNVNIHTRMQEISAAYVFNFTFRNWNPFLEAGPGGFIFSALDDRGTQQFNPKRTTNIGALYGGGIAYELSPSFDIRAEYRGIIVKAPDFGIAAASTKRYYNINAPAIGIAYHF